MAVLSDSDRFAAWKSFMQDNTEEFSLSKSDIREAINAADAWVQDNKISFNVAIPQPARNALSAAQKAHILLFVVSTRFGVGI